jgi:hypothetical protein
MLQPHTLITSQQKLHIGRFTRPVNEINVRDADYRTPMNRPASRWQKHFHFKQFQYVGGISDNVLFGCALADLRYVGAVFVYVYQPQTRQLQEWSFRTPLARGLDLTNRPDNGVSSFSWLGNRIWLRYQCNTANERKISLEIKLRPLKSEPTLSLNAEIQVPRDFQYMSLCTPTGANGWTYAQKLARRPVSGEIRTATDSITLDPESCFGHHDLSAGYMRRETFWNWACFSAPSSTQGSMGLNISWGVNETGYSENCFWLGKTLHPLPQMIFRFDRDHENSPWRIFSEDRLVDLSFTPEGTHKERLHAGILATNFRQIFGRFNGHVTTPGGKRHEIENIYGFVEDHYSKW